MTWRAPRGRIPGMRRSLTSPDAPNTSSTLHCGGPRHRAGAARAALARQRARAGARAAALELHLAAAQVARPLRVGDGEQAPARVTAVRATDRLQSHGADGFHDWS